MSCSGRVSTRHRRERPRIRGWSVPAGSPGSGPGCREGDSVCALLAGGGYAELVAVPAGQLLPIPGGVRLADAAALPEVACTVNASVFGQARLAPEEVLLVHGG